MAKLKASEFTFRKTDSVGAESAELDHSFEDCYIDLGDLEVLRDCETTKCLIVGRTGAGKSALLLQLEKMEEYSIRIEPEGLSLQYLSNSTILPQIEAMGVNLGLFYKLLWKHIFAVELIKIKFGFHDENDTRNFFERIWDNVLKDKERERAVSYLRKWGEEFWKDTEYRVREVTSKLEASVKDSIGLKYPGVLDLSTNNEDRYSVEEKAEIVKKLQAVVNGIQVRDLSNILKMLGETIFASIQPRFYVLLDDLDTNWVDDRFRFRLIKALVETIGEVNKSMPGVKIITSIRRDLLDRVIHQTRDAGFQEEKYDPLILKLKWSKEQLTSMLDRRINKLVRRRYSGDPVSWNDILPKTVNKQTAIDYLIERTMYRPRDLIVFFNLCIEQAVDTPDITAQMILHAEGEYSQKRLRSLYDEWHAELPELELCVSIIKRLRSRIQVNSIDPISIANVCLSLATSSQSNEKGFLTELATSVTDGAVTFDAFLTRIFSVFYRVGIVGLRTEISTHPSWSFRQSPYIPPAAIREDAVVYVCPMFWRALGITPESTGK